MLALRHPRASILTTVLCSALAAAPALAHDDPLSQIDALTREAAGHRHPAALLAHRGDLKRQRGDWRGALADFDAAAALDPRALDVLELCRGAALLDGGDAAGAALALDRFLTRHPDRADARWLRGRARLALHSPREAIADFDAAIAGLHRVTPDHYLERGRVQVALGETSAARAGLDEGMGRLGPAPALLELASRLGDGIHEGGAYETIDVTASAGMLVATEAGVPSLTRGPYLQVGTPTSVVVRWRTDIPTPSLVRYGLDMGALADSVSDLTPATEHELTLAGLAPSTRYYYEVAADTLLLAGADTSCRFVTAPPAGTLAATRVWVLGDSGRPGPNQNAVRDAYTSYTGARGTDVWLMLGDNAYQTGTDAEFQGAVFDPYAPLLRQWVLWPTRGNHEFLTAGPGNDYYDFFSLPIAAEAGGYPSGDEAYYSFDHANIHFVCLDSEGSSRDTTMLSWLENDLASAQADWVIAFWHHPPYTKGSHNSDDTLDSGGRMRDMRELALPILESWGVDLVLTGHSHSYERSYLLDEHYGVSSSFDDSMKVDGGNGRLDGDGPYEKASIGLAPHQGAVYAVAGSGSQISGGPLNHPAMVVSLNLLGSLVIDVVGNRLDALFLGANGAHADSFTVVKGGMVSAPRPSPRGVVRLAPAAPNPFRAVTRIPYDLPRPGHVSVEVFDLRGRRVATLARGEQAAGPHEITWDGGRVAAGAYFVLLRFEDQSRVSRVVRVE